MAQDRLKITQGHSKLSRLHTGYIRDNPEVRRHSWEQLRTVPVRTRPVENNPRVSSNARNVVIGTSAPPQVASEPVLSRELGRGWVHLGGELNNLSPLSSLRIGSGVRALTYVWRCKLAGLKKPLVQLLTPVTYATSKQHKCRST